MIFPSENAFQAWLLFPVNQTILLPPYSLARQERASGIRHHKRTLDCRSFDVSDSCIRLRKTTFLWPKSVAATSPHHLLSDSCDTRTRLSVSSRAVVTLGLQQLLRQRQQQPEWMAASRCCAGITLTPEGETRGSRPCSCSSQSAAYFSYLETQREWRWI